jgi:CRISPR system Cascade subunit CasB
MSEFIAWLEEVSERDTKVRAVLRRSLAFLPGDHIPSYAYVEPFLRGEEEGWRRQTYYLVAGLWAAHWREGREHSTIPLARACALHPAKEGNAASTERRFIHLLDSDPSQLPHRLRQMVMLLKEEPLDFRMLLNDVLIWNRDDKRVQNAWARQYYRTLNPIETFEAETETAA